MKMNISAVLAVVVSAIMVGSAVFIAPANRAYAHTFQGGESAEFLTMVEVIKSETSLAAQNLSDPEVAADHIEHASEPLTEDVLKELGEKNQRIATDLPASIEDLGSAISSGASSANVNQKVSDISDLLAEAVQVRIDNTQLTNSTVQAVVVSNLVNEALEHYGEAIGFEGNMTDMSTMESMNSTSTESGSGMNMSGTQSQGSMEGAATVVSEANYQSAQAFARLAQDKYTAIKAEAVEGTGDALSKLDAAFPKFIGAIDDKTSAMDVMKVAHLEIHPNLMVAYNLQVVPEFPLPLLVTIPAIAGAILYGRFSMKRT